MIECVLGFSVVRFDCGVAVMAEVLIHGYPGVAFVHRREAAVDTTVLVVN